jgi:hypothetical protein
MNIFPKNGLRIQITYKARGGRRPGVLQRILGAVSLLVTGIRRGLAVMRWDFRRMCRVVRSRSSRIRRMGPMISRRTLSASFKNDIVVKSVAAAFLFSG